MAGMTGKSSAPPGGPPAVVLVHGAWHGAWCWEPAIAALAAAGVTALAVDLPGHGDDPGPLGDLHGDAAHVTSVLNSLDGPVVLAGSPPPLDGGGESYAPRRTVLDAVLVEAAARIILAERLQEVTG